MSKRSRKYFQQQYPKTQAGLVAFINSQLERKNTTRRKYKDTMLADRISISIPELHALRDAAVRNKLLFLRPSPTQMTYSIQPFAEAAHVAA